MVPSDYLPLSVCTSYQTFENTTYTCPIIIAKDNQKFHSTLIWHIHDFLADLLSS